MILHYLAVALAKFRRTPFTTAANVLTLALGLACFIAAYGVASWWRAADHYHPDADRIVAFGQRTEMLQFEAPDILFPRTTALLAQSLREEFPELKLVARVRARADVAVAAAAGQGKALFALASADPEFFSIFDFDFLAGDPSSALTAPNGVVLTEEAARRLFGDAPALGQPLIIDSGREAVVTGVIAAVRQPSFMGSAPESELRFDAVETWGAAASELEDTDFGLWISVTTYTFAKLAQGASIDAVDGRLPDLVDRRMPDYGPAVGEVSFRAFPVAELATRDLDNRLFGQSGVRLSAVAVLLGLGVFTLGVACVNYANLAAAQAVGRMKEVGLRKVLGAGRGQVMAQAWTEATLLAAAAVVAALAALALAVPAVRSSTGVDVLYFLSVGAAPYAVIVALAPLVGLAAGAYPALVLSRVRPAEALETGRSRRGPQLTARILVAIQFASASFLLIFVTVTELQRAHIERTALAPREDPIAILDDLSGPGVDFETLRAQLQGRPGVEAVSVADAGPWNVGSGAIIELRREPGGEANRGFVRSVGEDYFEALNLKLLAGRALAGDGDRSPSSLWRSQASGIYSIVIDETYARSLGFPTPQSAVGEIIEIWRPDAGPTQPLRVVGVTEADTSFLSAPDGLSSGIAYQLSPPSGDSPQFAIVRLSRDDVAAAVAAITEAWDGLAPYAPANIRFYDDLFEASFRDFARAGRIFALLAGAAFVIASVGLLGMAVHVTSRRRHEIGVRKTLGSSVLGIVRLLLVDFSKPVLIANLLAWPAAYLAAEVYLQAFTNRIALTPAPFALSLALTLAIAWAAVIGEVLKAASVRPAEVLRHA